MNSFCPLFSHITDSSLWEESYPVRIAFITMMAKKDSDGIVYCDAYRLMKWANLDSVDESEEALRILSSPDTIKHGQPNEGRRIEKVEGGWKILNAEYYEKMMRLIAERARKARWARENRKEKKWKKKIHPLPGEMAHEKALAEGRLGDAEDLSGNQPFKGE